MLENAKALRSNQTDAAQRLWCRLRAHCFMGLKFKRQKPIGHYIVDFVCIEYRLIILLSAVDTQSRWFTVYDQKRDAGLPPESRLYPYTVLRFWNNDVIQQLEGVLEQIRLALFPAFDPSPSPSPVYRLPFTGEGLGEGNSKIKK